LRKNINQKQGQQQNEECNVTSKDKSFKDPHANLHLINFWAGLKEELPHIPSIVM
jgi:hypothetical protein